MTTLKLIIAIALCTIILVNIVSEIVYHKVSNSILLKKLDDMYHYSVGLLIVLVIIISVIG